MSAFLERWSRLKGESRRSRVEEAPAQAPDAPLSEEEIAALPRIEDLTADSDITAFMRRGVPEALRKAALRRAWLLDPGIRDFVGHARDYDYDWNIPGGAPGHGPLQPEEIVAAARRLFGHPAEATPPEAPVEAAQAEAPDEPPDRS
jgi:hypothetical protein